MNMLQNVLFSGKKYQWGKKKNNLTPVKKKKKKTCTKIYL